MRYKHFRGKGNEQLCPPMGDLNTPRSNLKPDYCVVSFTNEAKVFVRNWKPLHKTLKKHCPFVESVTSRYGDLFHLVTRQRVIFFDWIPIMVYTARNGEQDWESDVMGYYILRRTVHSTPGRGTGTDTIGFHTNFSVPVPDSVQCDWAIRRCIFQSFCSTPHFFTSVLQPSLNWVGQDRNWNGKSE